MFKDIFRKTKYVTIKSGQNLDRRPSEVVPQEEPGIVTKKELPDGLWVKCPKCGEVLFNKNLEENSRVCTTCEHHFRISATLRLKLLVDEDSFEEWDADLKTQDSLDFPGYDEKISEAQEKSGMAEGVLTGRAKIEGVPFVIAINEAGFMMGSMGSVVGEKITRAIERAIKLRLPVVIFSTSGGARMQEGILSLYQMAKTSAALGKLAENHLLYISVVTDPTFGGVTASYASLGDIMISEPNALIGFTGPRVIKQTMRQELPAGAQTAEFNQEHGSIDLIVARNQMRPVLARLLRYHQEGARYGTTV
ncbi:acetyl-CoA carboxylase, carboxyltransferase subunit beta [Desulfosporosinus sp.]|uniref:acetyl-CoA carboxylase, carboxyltransferase subunit beta n=1 Tax=Desulfosporosinus sp. TaxID=157907 RepID=UPI000E966E10|nr:acetyl-CoA carboxylase, carboxyltransferase subunit beta [Desulfosporosinus sp.]MBC2723244.1 acetyl-CoA carboxylase carboxyltransferase subunit beta [Desulfosporosinus sp.]MBC2729042.1 acetyl-CoA carboxylase carboxyltransferase subunit beta [Desulfosporosinus sp.]HBV86481.1 acetyl-CoA carboxylase carboxyl transferase subunit beta [Desulfosporosinus sp.]